MTKNIEYYESNIYLDIPLYFYSKYEYLKNIMKTKKNLCVSSINYYVYDNKINRFIYGHLNESKAVNPTYQSGFVSKNIIRNNIYNDNDLLYEFIRK